MSLTKSQVMQKILRARGPKERARIAKHFGSRGGVVAAIRKQQEADATAAAVDETYWWKWEM